LTLLAISFRLAVYSPFFRVAVYFPFFGWPFILPFFGWPFIPRYYCIFRIVHKLFMCFSVQFQKFPHFFVFNIYGSFLREYSVFGRDTSLTQGRRNRCFAPKFRLGRVRLSIKRDRKLKGPYNLGVFLFVPTFMETGGR